MTDTVAWEDYCCSTACSSRSKLPETLANEPRIVAARVILLQGAFSKHRKNGACGSRGLLHAPKLDSHLLFQQVAVADEHSNGAAGAFLSRGGAAGGGGAAAAAAERHLKLHDALHAPERQNPEVSVMNCACLAGILMDCFQPGTRPCRENAL